MGLTIDSKRIQFLELFIVHSESETDSQKSSKQGVAFSNKKDAIDAFKALLKDKVCLFYRVVFYRETICVLMVFCHGSLLPFLCFLFYQCLFR